MLAISWPGSPTSLLMASMQSLPVTVLSPPRGPSSSNTPISGWPEYNSATTHPKAHMSASSWKRRFPKKTSGGLYWGVMMPMSEPLSLVRSFFRSLWRGFATSTQPRSLSTTCGEWRAEERGESLRQDDGPRGERTEFATGRRSQGERVDTARAR